MRRSRTCSRCGKKSTTCRANFTCQHGVQQLCRRCNNEISRLWYEANKEKKSLYQKAYRAGYRARGPKIELLAEGERLTPKQWLADLKAHYTTESAGYRLKRLFR